MLPEERYSVLELSRTELHVPCLLTTLRLVVDSVAVEDERHVRCVDRHRHRSLLRDGELQCICVARRHVLVAFNVNCWRRVFSATIAVL